MSFAALEARVNASVMTHMANAQGLLDGVAVAGLFENEHAISNLGSGMSTTAPAFTLPSSVVPDDPIDLQLVVTQDLRLIGTFNVVDIEPDGTGLCVLILEKSS